LINKSQTLQLICSVANLFFLVKLSKTLETVPMDVIFIFTKKNIITLVVGFGVFLRVHDKAQPENGFHLQVVQWRVEDEIGR